MKLTIPQCLAKKLRGEKIVMTTGYDATFAKILDASPVDLILVGDSLGTVIQGKENTLSVTLDEIIYHARCVSDAAPNTLVIADLPFMSYQISKEQALLSAGRCLKETRSRAVKLEGGAEFAETVQALVQSGVPVMGHIGLQPQSIHQMGGYKIQGKTQQSEKKLLEDAVALQRAGCFAIVMEGIVPAVAKKITRAMTIPTIGIASGPHCDGQVLVLYDLLGMDPDWQPKFVKKYLDGASLITQAIQAFATEVRQEIFPSKEKSRGKKSDCKEGQTLQ